MHGVYGDIGGWTAPMREMIGRPHGGRDYDNTGRVSLPPGVDATGSARPQSPHKVDFWNRLPDSGTRLANAALRLSSDHYQAIARSQPRRATVQRAPWYEFFFPPSAPKPQRVARDATSRQSAAGHAGQLSPSGPPGHSKPDRSGAAPESSDWRGRVGGP